jgi:predicted phage-related endonuclease
LTNTKPENRTMKILTLTQGSPEWYAHRANSYNASDAPAMMGCSPYETRSELIKRLATGITPEVDAATQRRFDEGHRFEALARPLAEKIIGEELYPLVGTDNGASGLSRPISASFDGLTMMGEDGFEHKRLNKELRAVMVDGCTGADLSPKYRIQMESQCIVDDACRRVLFMASEWDSNGNLIEERHSWYTPDPTLRAEILAGWKQFDADLAAYVPPTPSAVEKIVAEPVEALPAVFVQVTGALALTDNFKVFEDRLRDFLAHRLIREPKTDQDFADLDLQIKAMKATEAALDAAEGQMLAQITAVDQAKKTKDMLFKLVRENRLMAEKLLASEKERRKGEIVAGGVSALQDHISALTAQIGKPYLPAIPADFGGAIKGLRSLSSMEDAVTTELARAKIVATETANRIIVNLAHLQTEADGLQYLFVDAAQMVIKPTDDFQAMVALRVSQHKAAEAAKEAAARERIRAEEQAKAEKDAREKLAAEQAEAQRLANEQAVRDAEAARQAGVATAPEPVAAPAPVHGQDEYSWRQRGSPDHNVVPIARPAADTGALVKLGDINASIAPLSITADGLAQLGFAHVATEKAAKLYRAADLPRIYAAMVAHIEAAQAQQAA